MAETVGNDGTFGIRPWLFESTLAGALGRGLLRSSRATALVAG
jgi:hypothetical protein